jgi:hypothetical protein
MQGKTGRRSVAVGLFAATSAILSACGVFVGPAPTPSASPFTPGPAGSPTLPPATPPPASSASVGASTPQTSNLLAALSNLTHDENLGCEYLIRQPLPFLRLCNGFGWIKADIPEIDIGAKPNLRLTVRTKGTSLLWLELINIAGDRFAGQLRSKLHKVPLSIQNTNGQFQAIPIVGLRQRLRPDVSDYIARSIAFSDAEGDIDISVIWFE